MLKSVIALVATSALAVKLFQHLGQQRSRAERRLHHDDVHRWEAEGGNLPEPATVAEPPAAPVKRRARRR